MLRGLFCCFFACLLVSVCGLDTAFAARQCGMASWYGGGGKTASGEAMKPGALTAAHRRLRFGKRVQVINMRNGRRVSVRVNDRGPFIKGRIIDVSRSAARRLGFVSSGVTRVCIIY